MEDGQEHNRGVGWYDACWDINTILDIGAQTVRRWVNAMAKLEDGAEWLPAYVTMCQPSAIPANWIWIRYRAVYQTEPLRK